MDKHDKYSNELLNFLCEGHALEAYKGMYNNKSKQIRLCKT